MRWTAFLLGSALVVDATVHALATPPSAEVAVHHQPIQNAERDASSSGELWKRRGGGGGGGRGGGGRVGGSSGGSRSGSSGGRGSPLSNLGGRTTTGSGPRPAYGGGRFYGGGASVPYKAGSRSSGARISPAFLAVPMLAFWPGAWLYGAYLYHHPHPYRFYNASSQENETKPVTCACDPYNVCGCDYSSDDQYKQYMNDLIGNGSYTALNHTLVTVADVNGTSTILINGTLPNGTTAAGGTESPNAAGDGLRAMLNLAGWWPVVATVCAIVLSS